MSYRFGGSQDIYNPSLTLGMLAQFMPLPRKHARRGWNHGDATPVCTLHNWLLTYADSVLIHTQASKRTVLPSHWLVRYSLGILMWLIALSCTLIALVVYDYLITVRSEIATFWRRQLTVTNLLLLSTRYLLLISQIFYFIPESPPVSTSTYLPKILRLSRTWQR